MRASVCALAVLLGTARVAAAADAGTDARPEAALPDAPTVAARVDKTEALVGDAITLTITAVGPATTPVNLPAAMELGPFSLLTPPHDEPIKDLGDGRVSRAFVLTIAAYEPGSIELPALEITYLGQGGHVRTARTAPVPVTIKSLIANEPEPKLKDNAPPVTVMEDNYLPVYIAGGLMAAGAGALIALAVRKRLRGRAALRPAPPAKPADVVALEKLDQLGAAGFPPDGDFRPFTFAVSEIIREYFGRRYDFDALEMTTEELLDELHARAGREMVMGEVSGWLTGCDLVKFAKLSPSAEEARGTFETALRLVTSTRPRPQPQVGQDGVAPVPPEGAHA